jgi:hypothetical protein
MDWLWTGFRLVTGTTDHLHVIITSKNNSSRIYKAYISLWQLLSLLSILSSLTSSTSVLSFTTKFSLFLLTKLTLWSRSLLERSPNVRTLDSFQAFYGTQRFNTEFTRALHLSLSWARPTQSTSPHPNSTRSIRIFSDYLRLGLPSFLLPSGVPTTTYTRSSSPPFVLHAPPIYSSLSNNTWQRVQIMKVFITLCNFLHFPVTSSPFNLNILFSTLFPNTPPAMFLPYYKTPLFRPVQNHRQNCSLVYCTFKVFRQQTRRQKVLDRMGQKHYQNSIYS